MRRILVTGAAGQIGSELTTLLRNRHGANAVVASDLEQPRDRALRDGGPFEIIDCLQPEQLARAARSHGVGTIYHLAALLSASGEARPSDAFRVNVLGLFNALEVAREERAALFFPSSIGAFGPGSPKRKTPQVTVQRPTSMYGITKVSGELLCDYYFQRYGVDTRGLRFPGLISYRTVPGGGTTDYAVDIFRQAVERGRYTCYLRSDTRLPMMYMADGLRAIVELMEADATRLHSRNAYNVAAMDFTPAELAASLARRVPGFGIEYAVDPVRQAIADSWPESLDDRAAREDWRWQPRFDLEAMTEDMLHHLGRP